MMPRFLMKTSMKSIWARVSLRSCGRAKSPLMLIEHSGHLRLVTVRLPSQDGHLRIIGVMVENIGLNIEFVKFDIRLFNFDAKLSEILPLRSRRSLRSG